jgi:hypothetical protein
MIWYSADDISQSIANCRVLPYLSKSQTEQQRSLRQIDSENKMTSWALFRLQIFLIIATVVFLFVFDNYYLIVD